jgi:hypothetical protein
MRERHSLGGVEEFFQSVNELQDVHVFLSPSSNFYTFSA